MKPSVSPARRPAGTLEPLEARIAPAIITVGILTSTQDTEYTDAPFVSLETAPANDPIAQAVGHLPHTFYLPLKTGDVVQTIDEQFLRVTSGNIVVFFYDA